MGQKNNFTIPKPCKENWLQMNPDEKSRFCTLCQKNVFDFSESTDNETNEVKCLRYKEVNEKSRKSSFITKLSQFIGTKK